jgi:hypothetical protein
VFKYLIQPCTSEQLKADQAKAKTNATAAAHQQSQKECIATLKDTMQAEQYTRLLEDFRSDLHIDHKSATNTNDITLSDSHLNLEDPINIPPGSLPTLPVCLDSAL